jgi:Zn-dependent protease with chaperone function
MQNDSLPKTITPVVARSSSLALRGLLAVILTVGFYGLALTIAGAMLLLVYAEVVYLNRIDIRLTLGLLIGAGTILFAIFPRGDRFTVPGSLLTAQEHPLLFEMIAKIASQVEQKMPDEVYLVLDVNAFVAERGGFMGFGRRRVMGIGLPLLQQLTDKQIAAVLAHEFGHYYRGDTALGPWIYQTRAAIIRTVVSLNGKSSILQAPFRWYGKLFLRITQAISRRQELVADALAASVAGTDSMISSLKSVHGLGAAYSTFLEQELIPVLQNGYQPPVADGFAQFARSKNISEAIERVVSEEMADAKRSPYDSHPPLAERIRSLETLSYPAASDGGSTRAIDLIRNSSAIEKEILSAAYGSKNIAPLPSIEWEDVGEKVFLVIWKKLVSQNPKLYAGLTALNFPEYRAPDGPIAAYLRTSARPGTGPAPQSEIDNLAGAGFAVLLANAGWKVNTGPGRDFYLSRDGLEFSPFIVAREMTSGVRKTNDWPESCQEYGIASLAL